MHYITYIIYNIGRQFYKLYITLLHIIYDINDIMYENM